MDLVSAANLEVLKLLVDSALIARGCQIQGKHCSLFMRFDSLHFDVTKGGGRKNSTRQLQNFGERSFIPQFVYSRATNHALHRYQRSDRGYEQCIAAL